MRFDVLGQKMPNNIKKSGFTGQGIMFSLSQKKNFKSACRMTVLAAATLLAACTTSNVQQGLPSPNQPTTETVVEKVLSANPKGEVLGNGKVRVALLLPMSIPGGAAIAAQQLKNGAAMAMSDFANNSIQLVGKDTKGQAAVAQTAASEAVSEGSSLVLGPLFAANVSSASGITLPANIVLMGFSTDSSVARRGVYLLSFTPENGTRAIIKHASAIGKRSITAFLPQNAEGAVRERALRETAGALGIAINIFKYGREEASISTAVTQSIAAVQGSDSIYISGGGGIPSAILSRLSKNGVLIQEKQILGSGAWETIKPSSILNGALYPSRDLAKFSGFSTRYQSKFGIAPGVQAAIGYDAVTLVHQLLRQNPATTAFRPQALENVSGFQGVNGIFRITGKGPSERGMAIYRISNGQKQVAQPAPQGFGRGS